MDHLLDTVADSAPLLIGVQPLGVLSFSRLLVRMRSKQYQKRKNMRPVSLFLGSYLALWRFNERQQRHNSMACSPATAVVAVHAIFETRFMG